MSKEKTAQKIIDEAVGEMEEREKEIKRTKSISPEVWRHLSERGIEPYWDN